jgi:hypothetical protein
MANGSGTTSQEVVTLTLSNITWNGSATGTVAGVISVNGGNGGLGGIRPFTVKVDTSTNPARVVALVP